MDFRVASRCCGRFATPYAGMVRADAARMRFQTVALLASLSLAAACTIDTDPANPGELRTFSEGSGLCSGGWDCGHTGTLVGHDVVVSPYFGEGAIQLAGTLTATGHAELAAEIAALPTDIADEECLDYGAALEIAFVDHGVKRFEYCSPGVLASIHERTQAIVAALRACQATELVTPTRCE